MKVSDLQGGMLDYWTARANESWKWAHELFPTMTLDPTFGGIEYDPEWRNGYGGIVGGCILIPNNPFRQDRQWFRPSTDWSHGGPLIERERIELVAPCESGTYSKEWRANTEWGSIDGYAGPTPLIAAMRAYVASKYGDEVPEGE